MHGRAEESLLAGYGVNRGAFHAFHQNLDVAVGELETLRNVTIVPTPKISLGVGSSAEALRCAAIKTRLSPAMAASSASTLDLRPTTNGAIMCGKTTNSRMGSIGSRSVSSSFASRWWSVIAASQNR